jgi:predicted nucleotidyltransferase component of viral defense system
LSDRPTLEELIEVRQRFGLVDEAQVEKDWFVVKALAAIAAVDKGPFQLVFQGGTALSRAHRIIERMSEDIDLKIIADKTPTRPELKRLRESLTKALAEAGFEIDPKLHRKTMYEGSYTAYRLPYKAVTEGKGVLRPEIFIETSVFPVRRQPVDRPVISYIAEAYGRPAELPAIACAAIAETAAEKFVALTRRVGSELAGLREQRDPTLVRHIYDLHAIRDHFDPSDVALLAREIMVVEAETRADNYPAYRDDPLGETLRAVAGLVESAEYKASYATLLRDMVYGNPLEYGAAIITLQSLAGELDKAKK